MFVKGDPKPVGSGVKKGHKHKPKPLKQSVALILDELSVNCVHQILSIIKSGKLSTKDQARAWFELLSYVYAKPRAEIDVTSGNEQLVAPTNIVSVEVTNKVLEALEKLDAYKKR